MSFGGRCDITENDDFSRYFSLWIVQNITRERIFTPRPQIYYPAHYKEKLYKIYDNVIEEGNIGEVNLKDANLVKSVMEELNYDKAEAETFLKHFEPLISIEQNIENTPEIFTDYEDFANEMFENLHNIIKQETIFKEIKKLKNKEREVMEKRYGFVDGVQHTLEEVGNTMELTRERIRQIETKALRNLRSSYSVKKLAP